jgi:hypothetical protein
MLSMAAATLHNAMNYITETTLTRLIRALGRDKGTRIGNEVLLQMGVRELHSQHEVLMFANLLIERGGVIESVGRAIKVSALLRGAVG